MRLSIFKSDVDEDLLSAIPHLNGAILTSGRDPLTCERERRETNHEGFSTSDHVAQTGKEAREIS